MKKNETLLDVAVDDDKNVLLLKDEKEDSAINLKLIKKSFTDNTMLVTNKVLKETKVFNSIHISQKINGYIVFGDVVQSDTIPFKSSGLYIWQMDTVLNSIAEDTIINKNTVSNISSYTINISANSRFSNILAAWDIYQFNTSNTYKSNMPSYVPSSILNYAPVSLINGSNVPSQYLYEQMDNSELPFVKAPTNLQLSKVYKIELFSLNDSNKIIWSNAFTDSVDNMTVGQIEKAKIIAGDKVIHLIYQIATQKKSTTLNHVSIYPDGSFAKEFFTSWDTRFDYDLDECTFTEKNELIITVTKGARVFFAKSKIE